MKKNIIDEREIERLSALSALDFDENGKGVMKTQVSGILEMLDACADVEDIETDVPTVSLSSLRDDVVIESIHSKEIINGAPREESGYIVVPRVVE